MQRFNNKHSNKLNYEIIYLGKKSDAKYIRVLFNQWTGTFGNTSKIYNPFHKITFLLSSFLLLLSINTKAQSSDSLNMTLLGHWDEDSLDISSNIIYNEIWAYVDCEAREYAIMGSLGYVHFFDITDPTNPSEIVAVPGTSNSKWRDIKTYKNRAYSVEEESDEGLIIYDLSNLPDTVLVTNRSTEFFTSAHNIFIDEPNGRLYVVGSNGNISGVIILDIATDPDNPILLGTPILEGGYVHDMYVKDHIGYAASGNDGLFVFDFTDPETPVLQGSLTDYIGAGYNHSNWPTSDGNYLVFADETKGTALKIANISDFNDIYVESQFKSERLAPEHTNSVAHNPFIRGQYAIVSYYHEGVQIYDISNPDSVLNVAYYDTFRDHDSYAGWLGAWGVYPFLPSGNIIASDIQNGLHILSVENITFETMNAPEPPVANLNVSGAVNVCEGEELLLELEEGADLIEWYNENGLLAQNTLQLEVMEAGNYWVKLSNGICESISDTLSITIVASPVLETPGAQTICQESPMLEAVTGFSSYSWYLNGALFSQSAENIVAIAESGTYELEVEWNGCSTRSEEFEVTVGSIPVMDLSVQLPTTPCSPLVFQVPDSDQTYRLFKNDSFFEEIINTLTVEEDGSYYVLIENEFCSMETPIISLEISEPIIPTISLDGNELSSSDAQSYQWYLSEEPIVGATAQNLTAMLSGEYAVEVTDLQGCAARSESLTVILTSDTEELVANNILLYPNPTQTLLYIDLGDAAEAVEQLQIYDILGQRIRTINVAKGINLVEIPTNNLSSGMYTIQFLDQSRKLGAKRFLKN